MKKLPTVIFCLSIFFSCQLYSQTNKPSNSGGSGGSVGPSNIVRPPLGGPQFEKTESKEPEKPAQISHRPLFTSPGIISLRDSGFVGTDHLYNISSNISVLVEITKSENVNIGLNSGQVQSMMESLFQKEGIETYTKPGPPLPFFQIVLIILPAGDGLTACCSGRLFEKVTLDRVILPPEVLFQAITWEYSTMIYASKEDMDKEIQATCSEIAREFLSRYKFYKNINNTHQ